MSCPTDSRFFPRPILARANHLLYPKLGTVDWYEQTHERGRMTDWEQCSAVERYPDRLSGAWVFCETRVPVSALFENLKDGASVEQFLQWFPGVDRWKVEAVLAHEVSSLAAPARS